MVSDNLLDKLWKWFPLVKFSTWLSSEMSTLLEQLPPEVLLIIFRHLDPQSRVRLSCIVETEHFVTFNDVYDVDGEGNNMMHIIAQEGLTDVLEAFLRVGFNVAHTNSTGETLLHIAIRRGHSAVAQRLINSGFPLNVQDKMGRSPLHDAITTNDIQLAKCLITGGASVSLTNKDGQNALHLACGNGSAAFVQLLICSGADINQHDCNGLTPLHWSVPSQAADIAKLLVGASSPTLLLSAVDNNGLTALHHSAYWGNEEMLMFLLDAGSNPNVLTANGQSALHHAVQGNHVSVARGLLKYGAHSDVGCNANLTPLQLARLMENGDMIKLLNNSSCDVNDTDRYHDQEDRTLERSPC